MRMMIAIFCMFFVLMFAHACVARPARVIAHRGASGYAPENTMASFRMAYEMTADMVELDVYVSVDGTIGVMHDDTVDRTTDGTGRIEDMTLEQIQKLDAGVKFDAKFKGERIPTLDEVLAWAAGKIGGNIEIKGAGCEPGVVELVRKYNMADKVIVSSFHHEYLAKIRELAPEIPTGALIDDVEDPEAVIDACHPDAINPRYMKLSKKQVKQAHELGLKVNVYTVNDAATMRMMLQMGADGIITNYPDVLAGIVDKKKKEKEKSKE